MGFSYRSNETVDFFPRKLEYFPARVQVWTFVPFRGVVFVLVADNETVPILLQPSHIQGHASHKESSLEYKDYENSQGTVETKGLESRKFLYRQCIGKKVDF